MDSNLLLLTIDAWRPDYVEEHAGVRLTPSLDALPWVRCTNAYTTAPWTSPGMVSIFTGESATRHGVTHAWNTPRPGTPALCRTLRHRGFHVPNLSYLNALDNYSNLGFAREEAPAPDDPVLFPALEATPEPFALWYHYRYLHLPYWADERFRRRLDVLDVDPGIRDTVGSLHVVPRQSIPLQPDWTETIRRLYAAGVLELDEFLQRTFETLARRGVLDRTTVVLTSDHGEELMEHGHVGHASTAHGATLFEEVLRVPLLISAAESRTETARVQTSDLYRTLTGDPDAGGVDLLRERIPHDRVLTFHSSLRGFQTPRELEGQSVQGWSDGRRKVVVERFETLRALEYDLLADPEERNPRVL